MNALTFTNRPVTSPGALTFAAQGGDVMWGRYNLSDADVEALSNLFWDEQHSARAAGDYVALAHADALINELLIAFATAKRWRFCGAH